MTNKWFETFMTESSAIFLIPVVFEAGMFWSKLLNIEGWAGLVGAGMILGHEVARKVVDIMRGLPFGLLFHPLAVGGPSLKK